METSEDDDTNQNSNLETDSATFTEPIENKASTKFTPDSAM